MFKLTATTMYHFSLLLFHLLDGISNHGNSSRIVATQTLSYMSCKSTATMVVMHITYDCQPWLKAFKNII
jgi:hypothetical protein